MSALATALPIASARTQIAGYLSTLIYVYILLIFLYIVIQLLFSVGIRPPYSRTLNSVIGFLRDICEPYLRIFRRAAAVVRRPRLQPDPRDHLARDHQRDRRQRPDPRLAPCERPSIVRSASARRAAWRPRRRARGRSRRSC